MTNIFYLLFLSYFGGPAQVVVVFRGVPLIVKGADQPADAACADILKFRGHLT